MRFDLNGILLGYFAILTSKKMEASEALDIYRDRDATGKMFRALKSGWTLTTQEY